ncbi:MAG: carboxypeptidase-like regulatory domain-containing protein [Thermoplasmatota archaeon]
MLPGETLSQDADLGTYLEGTVTNAKTDEPIEDAFIEVYCGRNYYWWPTDSNGYYKIELDVRIKEDLDIFCSNQHYYDDYKSTVINRSETKVIDFQLIPKNSTVQGYVYDSDTMDPMRFVYVELFSTERNGYRFNTYTDEDGFYRFYTEPGYYKLYCRTRDYESYTSNEFYVGDGEVMDHDIYLDKMETGLFGKIMDQEENSLEDAFVYIYDGPEGYYGYSYTDESGEYEIRSPPGEYQVQVSAEDYFTYNGVIDIEEDGMTELNIYLEEQNIPNWIRHIIDIIKGIIGIYGSI